MACTILAVADTVSPALYDHFVAERWRDVDLVLSCGDLPPTYLDFLCSSLNVPVLYVRGNHDDVFPKEQYNGCENAHGRILQCHGVRVAGFEGSLRYNHGVYQHTEVEMRRTVRRTRLRALRSGPPNIILAHAPPAGCHDAADLCHRGFACFRTAIDIWQPAIFVHGHVHAYNRGPKVSKIGETTVINAYPYHLFQLADVQPETEFSRRPVQQLRVSGDRLPSSAPPSGLTRRPSS